MVDKTTPRAVPDDSWPGRRLGLPPSGRGSLATWGSRILALVVDWAACMAIAVALFGLGVLTGNGWRSWMILAVFYVESATLTALAGGSLGQLVTRIAILRLDGKRLGLLRAMARAALVCLVLPVLVVGVDRRGLHDTVLDTVAVKRR